MTWDAVMTRPVIYLSPGLAFYRLAFHRLAFHRLAPIDSVGLIPTQVNSR